MVLLESIIRPQDVEGAIDRRNSSSTNLWSTMLLLLAMIGIPSAAVISFNHFILQYPLLAISIILLYEIGMFILAILSKVWQKLGSRWIEQAAEWVDGRAQEFINSYQIAIIGVPGSGKTTLLRHRALTFVDKKKHRISAIKYKMPVLLLLREHSNTLKDNPNYSLADTILDHLKRWKQFVHNWYLANEIMSSQRDDPGVHMRAADGAEELLQRLYGTPSLLALAVNPLLLTMIATVHRYRGSLPGKRVALYAEICEVFLGKRQEARGLSLELSPKQKQWVLQRLAFYMMYKEMREITIDEAQAVIREPLALVQQEMSSKDFLQLVENTSGILIERELGIYRFAPRSLDS